MSAILDSFPELPFAKYSLLNSYNVCKEIASMDLNDKTISSLQPNVSLGRYNLKLKANEINFENCSTQQYYKNPYRNPFQSSSLLAIRTFYCICRVIKMFLHCFKRLYLNFAKIVTQNLFICTTKFFQAG